MPSAVRAPPGHRWTAGSSPSVANRPSDPLPTAECFRSGKVTVAAVSGEWGAASSVQTAVKTARTEPAVVALTVRAQGRIAGPHGAAAESMAASHLPVCPTAALCGGPAARCCLQGPGRRTPVASAAAQLPPRAVCHQGGPRPGPPRLGRAGRPECVVGADGAAPAHRRGRGCGEVRETWAGP